MITEPELKDVLVRQADSYNVPPHDLTSLRAEALRRRRGTRLRYGAMAAAALLALGVASLQLRTGQSDLTPAEIPSDVATSPSCLPAGVTPAVPDSPWAGDGFLSDQPAPTTTAPGGRSCTLILNYGFHRFGAGTSGMAWLYSDGRLIIDLFDYGPTPFVQWEHRLTPAGVERIREAVVTMLDKPVSRPSREAEAVIHYGDGIVYPEDARALVDLLLDRSWLPDEYRVTENPSIYRAPWYLTCYEEGRPHGDDVEAAVRDLPSDARDMLASRAWTTITWTSLSLEGDAVVSADATSRCTVLSRADATVLVEALGGDLTVGTANVFPGGLSGPASQFSVHALMPDGTSGAHGD